MKADFRKIYYSGCETSRDREKKGLAHPNQLGLAFHVHFPLFFCALIKRSADASQAPAGFLRLTAEFRRAVKFYSISAERDGVQRAAFANSAPLSGSLKCARSLSLISRKSGSAGCYGCAALNCRLFVHQKQQQSPFDRFLFVFVLAALPEWIAIRGFLYCCARQPTLLFIWLKLLHFSQCNGHRAQLKVNLFTSMC